MDLSKIIKGTYIGIKDINNKKILNGDKVHVQFVNYMGTGKEYVDEEFNGKIIYNSFTAMFMILCSDKIAEDAHHNGEKQKYIINHRSMRIEKLN